MDILTLKQIRKEQEGGWHVRFEGNRVFTLEYIHDCDHWHHFRIIDMVATSELVELLRNGLPNNALDVVFESRSTGTKTKDFLVNFDFEGAIAAIKDCRSIERTLFAKLRSAFR